MQKITKSLSIILPTHILRSNDPRTLLCGIFSAWLPLSTALLVSVAEHLPTPVTAQASRMPAIISEIPGGSKINPEIREALTNLTSKGTSPAVAYVSKMVMVSSNDISQKKKPVTAQDFEYFKAHKFTGNGDSMRPNVLSTLGTNQEKNIDFESLSLQNCRTESDDARENLIGFARLYCGRLEVGNYVYVLSPKYNTGIVHQSGPSKVQIKSLYLIMGRTFEPISSVSAGAIFGIGGLENYVTKSATLSSQLQGAVNLASINLHNPLILRVALEPKNPADLQKMIKGLKLLEQSDPCVIYEVLESGEHVILTAGELHLQRCLNDLGERYAKCPIQVSEPTVPYRESIVPAPGTNMPKNEALPRGIIFATTPSKWLSLKMQIRPLPVSITKFLQENSSLLRKVVQLRADEKAKNKFYEGEEDMNYYSAAAAEQSLADYLSSDELSVQYQNFTSSLHGTIANIEDDDNIWIDMIDKIAAFGPRRYGANVLIDCTAGNVLNSLYVFITFF